MADHKLSLSSWERFWTESSTSSDDNTGPSDGLRRLLLDTTTSNNTGSSPAVIDHPELVVVQIPLSELPQRRFELPSRSGSFGILIHDEPSKDLLAQSLLVCSTPWRGRLWIVCSDTDDGWKKFREQHQVVLQHPPVAPPRLWAPDPLVANVLLPCLQQYTVNAKSLKVWDLGAGIGRDACFLAEALHDATHGDTAIQITAVDQRYRVPQSNETTAFWQRRGGSAAAASCCTCLCTDLQTDVDAIATRIEREGVDCVFAVRYWNRKLFLTLAERGSVPILAVSQFGKCAVGAEWAFATPKVRVFVHMPCVLPNKLPIGFVRPL